MVNFVKLDGSICQCCGLEGRVAASEEAKSPVLICQACLGRAYDALDARPYRDSLAEAARSLESFIVAEPPVDTMAALGKRLRARIGLPYE